MAKIGFTKLSLKRKNEVKTITINNNQIEIKQYLPVNEKLDLIARVINGAHDQNNFPNPIKIEVIGTLEMIMAYTNVSFTDKQKEDPKKLYDLVVGSGFSAKVFGEINPGEYAQIKSWVAETIHSIYEYKNSAAGILDIISTDYKDTTFDMEQLTNDI